MNKKFIAAVIFLSVILMSCVTPVDTSDDPDTPENPDNPDPPADVEELIPLSIGNQWAYRYISPTIEEDHLYRIEDVFPFTAGSNIYAVYEMSGPITTSGDTLSLFLDLTTRGFYNSNEGFHVLSENDSLELISALWFKYPCSAGNTYGTYIVNSTNSSVVNNYLGQTISCIHYIDQDPASQSEYFVSPGLGIVKAVLLNGSHIFEMTEYTIN
ncbi:hypothetical protein ACFLR4_01775 [Bacteroidota bacterium]